MKKRLVRGTTLAVASTALLMGGAGLASAHGGDGATANGFTGESPGVLSGNLLQVPVHVPVNVCGNTVNVIALLNPAFGNTCVNA
ncbi:chaplin [Streptomyces sp. NBC_00335]|uniref:chaplin n=1 Tax=unclassified Streptomyces TaxID=2593676 RepID=UPI00225AD9D1|nr:MULTISPECIES: chaplin [unclassified Streptomyces]MCX5406678.1 chaplin [Streptomyces sp. NBC_00086]